MHLNYSFDSLSHMPAWAVWLTVIAGLFWLFVLAAALSRADFDPVTKFMWVFVIVAASIFGALLYLLIAPAKTTIPDQAQRMTTCYACHATIPADASECPNCGKGLF